MGKKKWLTVCPACGSEGETEDKYTEDEVNKIALIEDTGRKRVIVICLSCLINNNKHRDL
ncbi:hypothetical protein PMSD_17215 [Paenibacillus macquariensis subsp. defensor]|nr:hypothetical protein PMSD_17215 [Paenibacillus macquariensis subsp. defensor]